MEFNDNLQMLTWGRDPNNNNFTAAIFSMTERRIIDAPSFIPLDSGSYTIGGLNNLGQLVCGYSRRIDGVHTQGHWCYYDGASWTDVYAATKSQVPAGWLFWEVKDIDDFGRIYGTMKKPDGSMTIVRLDPVPEPTTLAALGLGALLLRRKQSATNRAA